MGVDYAKVDVIVFGTTDTRTQSKLSVTNIKSFGMDVVELFKITTEAELISEYHLGQTIVAEALKIGLELKNEAEDFHVAKGHGIYATVGDNKVVARNRKLLDKNKITLDQTIDQYSFQEEKNGKHGNIYRD